MQIDHFVSTTLLPERSDTVWLNKRVRLSRSIFDRESEMVDVVDEDDALGEKVRRKRLKMHLIRSGDLARLYRLPLHSGSSILDHFDKFYHDSVLSLSLEEKAIILQHCYNANRHRTDLINSRYYHGVVDDSFTVACEKAIDCEYRLFEQRVSGQEDAHFVAYFYFPCSTSPHRQWSFYSLQTEEYKHIWHCPALTRASTNRVELSEILDVLTNQWITQSIFNYTKRLYPQSYSYMYSTPNKICNCTELIGPVLFIRKTKGHSRYQSGVWSLKRLCRFFIVNFFYNDKSLIEALLPPREFKEIFNESKIFTHTWLY